MNPDNTVEYNSLSWVKAQLDDVLADAQSNLNEKRRAPGKLHRKFAVDLRHAANG